MTRLYARVRLLWPAVGHRTITKDECRDVRLVLGLASLRCTYAARHQATICSWSYWGRRLVSSATDPQPLQLVVVHVAHNPGLPSCVSLILP